MSSQETKLSASEIIEKLSSTDGVKQFLHDHGITKVAAVKSIEHYEAGNDRQGIIVKIQEAGNDNLSSVMIDVRKGQPSTEQVYDAVYGVGKDCSKRVIVYDDAQNDRDTGNSTTDHYVVGRLIKAMDDYPLNLYHVKPNEFVHGPETFDLSKLGMPTKNFSIEKLPSPLHFRIAEFWEVIYNSINGGFYHSWEAFDGGIRNDMGYGHYFELNGLDVTLKWTENGIDFSVVQTEDDNDYLMQIWQLKEEEFRRQFDQVTFNCQQDKLTKIQKKYLDRPVSWLATAGLDEKITFAKQLHNDFLGFKGNMDEVLWDIKKKEAA
jgi:hypothetical protein